MSDARIRLSVSGAAEVVSSFDSVRKSMGGVESAAASVRSALGSIGASLSVAAMAAFVKQTIDGVDALNDLKDATGASIENISALEDVARRTGAGIDTVGTALIKLNQGLANAKPGSDAAKAFSALNLSIKDMKALDPAQAMLKTAVALSGFADDANKARLVQELFGKSMKEVAPLLKDLAEAGELNAKVMTSQAEAAEKFNKELFQLQKNATDASRSIIAPLVESINESIERFRAGAKEGKSFYAVIRDEQLRLLGLNDGPKEYAEQLANVNAQLAKGDTRLLVRTGLLREQARLQAKLNELGVIGAGGGRGSVNPDAVDGRLSAPDIGGGGTVASSVAARAAAAAAAELKKQQDLLATLSGYTASYADDVQRLITMQASGKLSQEAYNVAVNDLVNSQPGVKAVLDERAKAVESATNAGVKAYEDQTKAHDEYIKSLNASADAVAKQVQTLQDEEQAAGIAAAQNITLAEAIEQVELARLQETYAKVQGEGADGQMLLALQKEIEARRKLMGLVGAKEAREANVKGAKDALDEWKKTAESINNSITDALLRGFESGKGFAENFVDTVKNMFNTMVLRPVISAIISPVSGAITGMMGMSGAASAADGVSGAATAINGASMLSGMKGWLTDFGGSFAGTMNTVGQKLYDLGLEKIGGGLMDATSQAGGFSQIASYAQTAGDALGYLNTAILASQGKWGASIGSGIGTYFGGPIGSAIGGAIGGWVDNAFGGGSEYTTGTGISGKFSGSGFAGRNYQSWRNEGSSGFFGIGGSGSSSGTNYSAMATEQTKALGMAFAGIKNQTADFASALGLSAATVQGFSKDIRISMGSDAEANKTAIAAMFKGIADEAAATVLDAKYIRQGEAAADTLARLATNLTIVNGSLDTLGKTLLATSQAGGDMASALVDQMGGLQQFQSSMSAYYQTYYSEEERLSKLRLQTTAAFATLGIAMPETLQSFRDLVSVQDLTSESGRSTYATLIGLSGVFAQVTNMAGAAQKATQNLSDAMGKTVTSAFNDLRALVSSAERDLVDAFNSAAGALADTAERFGSIQDIFKDFAQTLTGATGAGQSLAYLRTEFTRLSDLARLGDAVAASKAVGVGDQLAARILATATSRSDADLQLARLAAQANLTSSIAEQQKTIAQQQLDTMKEVVGKLVDVESKTLSVEEAMNSLRVLQSVENTSIAAAIAGGFGNLLTASGLSLDGVNKSNTAISKGNDLAAAILSGINTMAGIQQAQEAERLAIAKAAEDERLRQGKIAALNQTGLSAAQAYQSVAATQQTAIGGVKASIGDIWSLASAYGLTLQAQSGQTGNTAQFGVDGSGQFSATYNQITGNAANFSAFKNAFYATGGVYDRTYGKASTLASLATQVSAASAELERQRDLVRALGATPAFASGGYHSGGLRLVGERGPELEVTGPSQIYNGSQLRSMLQGGNTARLEALVERQAQQLEAMEAALRSIALSSMSTAKTLRDVTPNRTSITTATA